jgi:hypothetical protein
VKKAKRQERAKEKARENRLKRANAKNVQARKRKAKKSLGGKNG